MIDSESYMIVAALLLVNLLIGLIRLYRGASRANRLMATQLIGTTTAAILLLLAEALAIPALRDVALLFTLLATLIAMAFVRLVSPAAEESSS